MELIRGMSKNMGLVYSSEDAAREEREMRQAEAGKCYPPRPTQGEYMGYRVTRKLPPELEGGAVKSFLKSYGYDAEDPDKWKKPPNEADFWPTLNVSFISHREIGGQMFYSAICSLQAKKQKFDWQTERLLVVVREGVHDVVKEELGLELYATHFGETPFANSLAPPGTTERLHKWCLKLSELANDGMLKPKLMARILQVFEVPKPTSKKSETPLRTDASGRAVNGVPLAPQPAEPVSDKVKSELRKNVVGPKAPPEDKKGSGCNADDLRSGLGDIARERDDD